MRRAALLTTLALAACAVSPTAAERHDGVITKGGRLRVAELRAGDCLQPDGDGDGSERRDDASKVHAVPCASPHTDEVVGIALMAAKGDYPGSAAIASFADRACPRHVVTYTGESELPATFTIRYLVPSKTSWKDDDRRVACVVVSAKQRIGSLRSATVDGEA